MLIHIDNEELSEYTQGVATCLGDRDMPSQFWYFENHESWIVNPK